jgi:D-alanine-D-alanine ligase-like ATP-grasp enzyme
MSDRDKKIRVGIVRGGNGEIYLSSLKNGGDIISHILEHLSDKYKIMDILIDKDHIWHMNGLPINPSDLMNKVDVVWNTSHSTFSNIIETLSLPYIGNKSFLWTLKNNKDMLRQHLKSTGVSVPRIMVNPKNARAVFEKFPAPWTVKIKNELGNEVKIAKTFNELAEAIQEKGDVIVEEFISGKVASVHAVPSFRGQDIYTFPLGNTFGVFSAEEKEIINNKAKELNKHIGNSDYLKADFVLNNQGKIYLLNMEFTPDFNNGSHFHQVCESVGVKTHNVLEHIINRALNVI